MRKQIEEIDQEFEKQYIEIMNNEDWNELYELSNQHLKETQGKSFKGFFYMGISFYKNEDFENAIRAF